VQFKQLLIVPRSDQSQRVCPEVAIELTRRIRTYGRGCLHVATTLDAQAHRAARVRKWPRWTGRLRSSAADRPAPLPRGAYLDETPGPGLLLAVQGYERDLQLMRSRDVHSVDATEPNLGGKLCGGAPQSAVDGHQAKFGESEEHLHSLVRELRLTDSPRERSGHFRQEQRG
jgi:hypothetical protein